MHPCPDEISSSRLRRGIKCARRRLERPRALSQRRQNHGLVQSRANRSVGMSLNRSSQSDGSRAEIEREPASAHGKEQHVFGPVELQALGAVRRQSARWRRRSWAGLGLARWASVASATASAARPSSKNASARAASTSWRFLTLGLRLEKRGQVDRGALGLAQPAARGVRGSCARPCRSDPRGSARHTPAGRFRSPPIRRPCWRGSSERLAHRCPSRRPAMTRSYSLPRLREIAHLLVEIRQLQPHLRRLGPAFELSRGRPSMSSRAQSHWPRTR